MAVPPRRPLRPNSIAHPPPDRSIAAPREADRPPPKGRASGQQSGCRRRYRPRRPSVRGLRELPEHRQADPDTRPARHLARRERGAPVPDDSPRRQRVSAPVPRDVRTARHVCRGCLAPSPRRAGRAIAAHPLLHPTVYRAARRDPHRHPAGKHQAGSQKPDRAYRTFRPSSRFGHGFRLAMVFPWRRAPLLQLGSRPSPRGRSGDRPQSATDRPKSTAERFPAGTATPENTRPRACPS